MYHRRAALLLLALAACSNNDVAGGGSALACDVDPPTSCPPEAPTYASVQPILEKSCVPCHDGADPDGPWPLRTYKSAADWAEVIRADLMNCSMPPEDGGVPLSDEERQAILTWIRCDYPP